MKKTRDKDLALRLMTYLTEREVAALLKVSQRTLQGWRGTGLGPPFVKIGGRLVRYIEEEVQEWAARNRFSSTSGYDSNEVA